MLLWYILFQPPCGATILPIYKLTFQFQVEGPRSGTDRVALLAVTYKCEKKNYRSQSRSQFHARNAAWAQQV